MLGRRNSRLGICTAVLVLGCGGTSFTVVDAAPGDVRNDMTAPVRDASRDAATSDGRRLEATVDAGVDAPRGDATKPPPEEAGSDASVSPVSVRPKKLQFGDAGGTAGFVACGTSPSTETFTITNNTPGDISWWTAFGLGASTPYTLSSDCTPSGPCALGAGASTTVTVTGPAVPANAGTTTYDDTLTVLSTAPGDLGHTVQLEEASFGAILQFSPTDQNFGQQPINRTYSQTVQVINVGNAAISATLALSDAGSPEFSISPMSVAVPVGGAGASFTASFMPGSSTTPASSAVSLSVPPDSTCGALPENLTLEGQGTTSVISVTPSLNFNSGANGNGGIGVSCGKTGPVLTATVTNTGSVPASITTLALGLGTSSPFTVSYTGTLPLALIPGTPVSITVTPLPVPASIAPAVDLSDTLTVTTQTGDAGTPRMNTVVLHETSAGALLALGTTDVTFNSTVVGQQSSTPISVTNSGNLPAPITFSVESPDADSAVFTFTSGVVVPAGGVASPNAYFAPTAAETYTATGAMTVASGTPLCSGTTSPSSLMYGGTGLSGTIYTVMPSTLAFGDNTCAAGNSSTPGTPPAAQPVSIQNSSSASAPWTATLGGARASFFTLSPKSGTVEAESGGVPGEASFNVQPIGLSKASGLTLADMAGISPVVTVVVGSGATAQTFTVDVTEKPSGAFADFTPVTVSVPEIGDSAMFSLENHGSTTSFTLATGSILYGVSPSFGTASPGAPLEGTVTNASSAMGSPGMVTATLTNPAAPLCAPLPPPLQVNPGTVIMPGGGNH